LKRRVKRKDVKYLLDSGDITKAIWIILLDQDIEMYPDSLQFSPYLDDRSICYPETTYTAGRKD